MWNSLKCAVARTLYIESQEEYNIDELIAGKAVDEILGQLEPVIKAKLDINNQLPLIDAAKFIHDIFEILESKKVGLAVYPPYIDYMKNITELNNLWLNTLERIGGNTIIESKDKDDYLIIPGKSVGPIDYNTTINDLITFYGKENIETKSEYTAGEGTELETLTYIIKDNIIIKWKNPETLTNPLKIIIGKNGTQFSTEEGVKVGISAAELGIINKGPFETSYLEVEPNYFVSNWEGRFLAKYGTDWRKSWFIKLNSDMKIIEIDVFIKDHSNESSFKITSPVGGESLQKGQEILIKWEANEASGSLYIILESNDESKTLIGYNIIKSGSAWVGIPYTIKNGKNWHILLVAKSANNEVRVQSEKFSIWGGD
jgi:hypothetical protein